MNKTPRIKIRSRIARSELSPIQVVVLYDQSHSAFINSATHVAHIYRDCGANVAKLGVSELALNQLDELVNDKDRLLIHYIGHGRNSGDSPYPEFSYNDLKNQLREFDLQDIHLSADQRATTIVIYDCCNILPESPTYTPRFDNYPAISSMLTFKGELTIMSSQPGEYSYYLPNETFFTHAFSLSSACSTLEQFIEHMNDQLRRLYKSYTLPSVEHVIYVLRNREPVHLQQSSASPASIYESHDLAQTKLYEAMDGFIKMLTSDPFSKVSPKVPTLRWNSSMRHV